MPSKRPGKRSKEVELAGCDGMSLTNRRILELRKEKSRDAARSRRGKENYEFYELAKLLPLPAAITSQLDKASIIRLSISYLKLRDFSSHGDPPWHRDGPPPNKSIKGGPVRRRNMAAVAMEIFESHQGTHILQSLDGFGFALANDGRFLYISETVSIYLGLSQVEMTGSSIFDYVHIKDHPELAEHLGLAMPQGGVASPGSLSDDGSTGGASRPGSPTISDKASIMNASPRKGPDRSFCIRMKSTLTKRGVHVKSSGYRVVHIIGHHRPQFSFSLNRKQSPPLLGMVALAIALPPPTITELRMESDTFIMRFSPDLKVLYCEPKISELMDLAADDVTGNSLYEYCHAGDLQRLRKSHVDLLRKGQVMTEYYRMMSKHGGYVWVQTCATTICTAKNLEDQNVVAVNYVLSGVEYAGCVMDEGQLGSLPKREPDNSDHGSDAGSDKETNQKRKTKEDSATRNKESSHENGTSRFGSPVKVLHTTTESKSTRNSSSNQIEESGESDVFRYSPQSSTFSNNDSVFHDRIDCLKLDNKNSRRKMDRPRKRKREVDSDSEINGMEVYEGNTALLNGPRLSGRNDSPELNGEVSGSPNLSSSPTHLLDTVISPVPEDLSVKASNPSPVQHPSVLTVGQSIKEHSLTNNSDSSTDMEWSKTRPGGKSEETLASSSVKDLEEAMNKHLPLLPEGTSADRPNSGMDSLVENRVDSSCIHAKQKSTIQWIGSQQPAPDPLAASNLLRSLYANRESVIRTNICNSRPHYYPDSVALNMLTPPGNETYKDSPQMSLHPLQYPSGKSPSSHSNHHHNNMAAYPSTPITVSMTTHVTDTSYNMTPPSSVSPQDKFVSPFSEGGFSDSSGSSHCQTMTDDTTCHRLHAKPQLYSVPMPAHLSAYTERSSHLTYPSISSYNSTGASFPTYASPATNLSAEPSNQWYPAHFATP